MAVFFDYLMEKIGFTENTFGIYLSFGRIFISESLSVLTKSQKLGFDVPPVLVQFLKAKKNSIEAILSEEEHVPIEASKIEDTTST